MPTKKKFIKDVRRFYFYFWLKPNKFFKSNILNDLALSISDNSESKSIEKFEQSVSFSLSHADKFDLLLLLEI